MHPPRITSARRTLVLLLVAAFAATGTAGAAPGNVAELEIDPLPDGTLPPGRTVTTDFRVHLCAAAGGLAGPRHVALETVDAPEWLESTFEPDRVTFPAVLPGQCDTVQGILRLNASTEAPAYETFQADYRVRDVATDTVYDERTYLIRTGFWGDLEVSPKRGELRAPEGEAVRYAVTITNTGNADTKFLVQVPGSVRGLQVAPPSPVTLAPGDGATVEPIFIAERGGDRTPRDVTLLVTSHAYYDHEAWGGSAVVKVRVTPEAGSESSKFAPVPAWAAVAALAGGVLALNRGRARR